jgi:hypothetical protein
MRNVNETAEQNTPVTLAPSRRDDCWGGGNLASFVKKERDRGVIGGFLEN